MYTLENNKLPINRIFQTRLYVHCLQRNAYHCINLLETMRFIQHNATAHGSQHASKNNKQSDSTHILFMSRIIDENNLTMDDTMK